MEQAVFAGDGSRVAQNQGMNIFDAAGAVLTQCECGGQLVDSETKDCIACGQHLELAPCDKCLKHPVDCECGGR